MAGFAGLLTATVALLCFVIGSRATLVRQFIQDATSRNAICLDGSDAGYYLYRNTSSSKWIIHLQGGGYCASVDDCSARANTSQGSSNDWACALPNQMTEGDDDAAACVSSDSRRNPNFRYWNRVYVPYCSGDLWLGQNYNATANMFGVSMSGHYIILAVLNELLNRKGMNMATDVIFGGSSAGSIGVLMHLEDAAIAIKSATRLSGRMEAFVGGYADGWTRLYPTLAEYKANSAVTPETSPFVMSLVYAGRFAFQAYVPPSCASIYPTSQAPLYGFQCADVRWGARAITSAPLLVMAARWDTYNIFLAFGDDRYTCANTNLTLDTSEAGFIEKFGKYSHEHMLNISRSAVSSSTGYGTSVFFTNCYTHTFTGVEDKCSRVNGTTAYSTLARFAQTDARAQRRLISISPAPSAASPLRCNSDCGADQCAWGVNSPLAVAPTCPEAGNGFQVHRFGQLCSNIMRRAFAVADTFSSDAILFPVVNATARKAVCLDDTPFAYFIARNSSTTKWSIFLQGGGYCSSAADCNQRAGGFLGSSKNYPCTLPAGDADGGGDHMPQPVNADPNVNPYFHTWNRVYILYCSGDTFIGRKTKADGNVFRVSTAGHYGVVAVVEDLLNYHGLNTAKTVVIGGTSAGSIGAVTNLDLVNKMINTQTQDSTKVIGFGDGGWFRAFPTEAEIIAGSSWDDTGNSGFVKNIASLYGFVFNAYHDAECLFSRKNALPSIGGHDCLDARYTFPFLSTPAIMLTARWDTYDLYLKFNSYACASVSGKLTTAGANYTGEYGRRSYDQTRFFRSQTSAIFMPSCYKHGSFSVYRDSSPGPLSLKAPCGSIDGTTSYQGLVAFIDGALRGVSNLDEFSRVAKPPTDALQLACNGGCGAKQCVWATNVDSSFKGSCPGLSNSFGGGGISVGLMQCSANATTGLPQPSVANHLNLPGSLFLLACLWSYLILSLTI